MDDINSVNPRTDSTYQIIQEALHQRFIVMFNFQNDIFVENGKSKVIAQRLFLDNDKSIKIKTNSKKIFNVDDFDVVLIRQDPPLNMNYITNTYLIDIQNTQLNKKPFFINSPSSLRNFSEKIFPLIFPKLVPVTLITSNKVKMFDFLLKYKQIVIKPLYEKGGNGIKILKNNETQNYQILKDASNNFTSSIVLQKYLSNIKKGDKRVLLINGEPAGAVNRVPPRGNFKANLNLGGKAEKTTLSVKERKICKTLKPYLQKNNFFFVGIDIIDEKLTEINVTSPTGICQINELDNVKLERKFWIEVRKKLNG
tara:strand:- start:35 stop:967 length:933 start_codon:yes stop_codon:yes gene_type:complete